MPNTTSLTLSMKLTGYRETLAAFKGLPADASTELRAAALNLSEQGVGWIQSAARADSPQAAALAPTVRAMKDRTPNITIGGAKRITSRRVPAYVILFGANFGAVTYRVPGKVPYFVHDHAGKGNDYWIWATIEEHQTFIDDAWGAAADTVLDKWANGGSDV